MAKEFVNMNFSQNDTAMKLINSLAKLSACAISREHSGLIKNIKIDDYDEQNSKIKACMLSFAKETSNYHTLPKTKEQLYFAMDNGTFRAAMNSIVSQAISVMMINYDNPILNVFASVENVGAGESKTYEIDTKSLPIAQRGNHSSNLSLVPSYAKSAITITPKVYSQGVSLDYVRLLDAQYDWGYAVGRIYAGLVYAQHKLVTDKIFNTAILAGTPFYQATYANNTYLQMADDIAMLNGSGEQSTIAIGTRVAFNKISGVASTGGFVEKDEYIRNGLLKEIVGVQSTVVQNFSNLSAPFTTANATSLRAIPNDIILQVSRGKDPIVRLVRESYIRVIETPNTNNNLNRTEYSFFNAFDADIATASYFGVQNTATA